ncbi:MAG: hypothetical protein V4649_16370 [Bacteroidota bacterium]
MSKKNSPNKEQHNIDKYPGYPHHPASEDITRPQNNNGKQPFGPVNDKPQPFNDTVDERDDAGIVEGTEADLTREDLMILQATEQNMDTRDASNLMHSALDTADDDGDPLNEESSLYDVTGSDLDVPGSESDDDNEAIGEEDEENNYYSLGGDNHEGQEESRE